MTKVLASGTNLASVLDIDEILRYTAAQNYLVNLDNYIGAMYHNYYLIEVNGIFSIIPWDTTFLMPVLVLILPQMP